MASPSQEKYDTEAINANVDIVELVSRYAPLKKDGKEYKALCLFHTEKSPSMTVSPDKGFLHCFGCGAHHDPISFLMAVEGVDFKESCRRLLNGSGTGSTGSSAVIPQRTTKLKKAPPRITTAPPADNNMPDMVIRKLGAPVAVYTYTTADGDPLGYVARYHDSEADKKTIRCWTYGSRSEQDPKAWACGHFTVPRPIYNLHGLTERPTAQVLIVEGEKAADAAKRLFPGMVVTTWPGGTESVDRADWSHLQNRKAVLLPDNDEPGIKAMLRLSKILYKTGAIEVKGITPTATINGEPAPAGWDLADEPEDMQPPDALAWAKKHVFVYPDDEPTRPADQTPAQAYPADSAETPEPANHQEIPLNAYSDDAGHFGYPDTAEAVETQNSPQTAIPDAIHDHSESALPTTSDQPRALATNDKGALLMNLDNAVRAIELDHSLKNHIWYDEFLDSILTDWNGETRQWKDADDVLLCLYLQRHIGLTRISVSQAHDAALVAAFHDRRNECRDWLSGLEWDETERLPYLLSDGFGAQHNAYTQAVGRCWLVSVVARVMRPGCKVDTVPVLEGGQGIGKSSALAILGGKWFVEGHESVMTKDFFGVLDGHMMVEISEMHAFTRAELERVKGIISCQVDRYRKAYGRNTENHPRHTVLVCTTNRDDWQRDDTGARRFWPVACGDINLHYLTENRDQLFAEAVYRYNQSESWWDVPNADQLIEADARRDVDSWESIIEQWLQSTARTTVTVGDILTDCLEIETKEHDQMRQKRVGRILRALGWENKPRRDENGRFRKVWMRK